MSDPANQSKPQEKVHDSHPLKDSLYQPEPNSSPLSRFIHECGNLPPSFPQRAPQTIGLTSSPVSTTEISFLSSDANDSSRFSPPASGPSPRRYQKDRTSYRRYQRPTAADFFSPRSSRHPSSPSSPVVQTDVNDILLNSALSNDGSTYEAQPRTDSEIDPLPSSNQDDNSTQSQPSQPTPSDSSLKRDAFKDKWTSAFSSDIPWSEFCSLCDEFVVETRSLALEIAANSSPTSYRPKPLPSCNRPSGRRPAFRHRPLLSNPAEAQRIQTLYRHSRKKAARKILSPNCTPYSGSIENAESFFKDTFSLRNCDITSLQDKLNDLTTPAAIDDSLFTTPTNKEIRRKLVSAANTSPGPDRVEYRHLKRVDPSCSILSLLFSHCFKKRDVPPAWKSAITVLIYKKGSTDDPSNFRPIALMSCLYKLVMGVIAKRLTSWAIDNDLLSKEQKSARPSEGCYEHTFLLQSIIGEARRSHKNAFVAWLDLRNAFGSTVLLRNNLTENAFGTRPKRVLKCVPFAFHLRSICVPFAFHLRSICVPFPFAFHFYWNAPAFRVPVTLVSKPDSVGNHRYFPSINQRYFHILCLHVCKERTSKFLLGRVPAAFQPRSGRVPTAFGTHLERERSVRLFLSSTVFHILQLPPPLRTLEYLCR